MIQPRATRLHRAPDLRAQQRVIESLLPPGLAARAAAVVVPTRSAAEVLRRSLEDQRFTATPRPSQDVAFALPDFVTRGELYHRCHSRLPDAPPLLTELEREVLLRLAADDAVAEGARAPFRLRPGLLAAMLAFYDELRRRGRTIDSLDRHVRTPLEAGRDIDRGAARLLEQTHFLSATFAAFERRLADSGRLDEHALGAMLLTSPLAPPYRQIVVAVADRSADVRGLWPADFNLLSRMPGLERVDVIATERLLASGWHQRLHEALPGLEEVRWTEASTAPVLVVPTPRPALAEPAVHVASAPYFVSRDREEELADAARWIKARARAATIDTAPSLERTALIVQRPLPYLYLARQVLESASIPYQALDQLPLAAEPFAAAIDLLFAAVVEEGTRTPLIELLASPHWDIRDPAAPDQPLTREEIAALDRRLQERKYLGGLSRLAALGAATSAPGEAHRQRQAERAARPSGAAAALAAPLEAVRSGTTASAQITALLAFVASYERLPEPGDPIRERHLRARSAVLGALSSLGEAHARYDDRPLPIADLVATIRRWIEGQTFAPGSGSGGVLLLDAPTAAFASLDAVRLLGLVESDWPERSRPNIFYPASLLRDLGWPPDSERLAAHRARFQDLLALAADQVAVSTFTLEEDTLVPPSALLEDIVASGLAVRQVASEAARIFTHEALSTLPVVGDRLPASAAGWLALRQARTPHLDRRFHGEVGRRASEMYAVSRIERYLDCPFKYFAGHVLRLEEEREDESGLSPQERGQLLHGVFEAFFKTWREAGHGAVSTATLDEAVALFATVAESQLAGLPDGDRALERTYLLGSAAAPGLAERAFAFEIEQGGAVIERLLEHPLEGSFTFAGPDGPRQVRLRGKADRIDLLSDGTLRIVDYKLGRAPKGSRSLQLPIYGACAAQHLEGRHGRSWRVGRAGYVAFRERNAFVDLGGRAGNLAAALADGEQRLLGAVDRIEAGAFPPSPDEPWTCTRCGFSHVCRKDYVGDE